MRPVDWRRLYADNQAAIAGRLPRVASAGPPQAAGDLVVHRPAGLTPTVPAPMLVVLHGCTQDAASLAADTRLNAVADLHDFVVAYPEQAARCNARRCWNWFDPGHQARGAGEPALLAEAVTRLVAGAEGQAIDRARVFVAGFSAGGAMACVLAATYPELFAGLAVHSGLAYRSAAGLPAALQAMRRGAHDPRALGRTARGAMGERARELPTIVLHGTTDPVVHPVNGEQVTAQWREVNGVADRAEPDSGESRRAEGGHPYLRRRWTDGDGRPVVEQIAVDGLGHAWAGGEAGGAYADPRGPSASDAIWRFFSEAAGGLGCRAHTRPLPD